MAQKLAINACHLYGDLMNTYGDDGNIICLENRCQKRDINFTCETISLGEKITKDYDLIFFGGGQDKIQEIVAKDLKSKKNKICELVEEGSAVLSICGGYQLFQHYFKTYEGTMLEGIGIFDAHTLGSGDRMIQNILVEISPEIKLEIEDIYPDSNTEYPTSNLVGFENHSGKTYLKNSTQPLGKVIAGAGNNGEDKNEGAVYKNAFGCYLHGSLLPKNPHLADYFIAKALGRKYKNIELAPLDDKLEWQAHTRAIERTRSQS